MGGKYAIDRVLGAGGVGIVLAARHLQLDETVAIKFLRPEARSKPDVVRRFAREAKAAVQIKSEYAARVFDVGEVEGRGPYFVMEYLDGKDLGDVLSETGPMSVRRAVEYVMQTCEALAVAHACGIIHRDVKPENLFLARRRDGSELIKVLDFGISKAVLTGAVFGGNVSSDSTQDLMGSPSYMSPEQIRSTSDVDHRADIWSLGVVLYELLTGQVPFHGETITKVCAAVLEAEPAPLAAYMAEAPEGLQAVIDRCLEKNVAQRFQNVAELAIALLPFGPTMARIFAERASSVLRASGHSVGVAVRFSSAPPPSGANSTLKIPRPPGAPVFSTAPGSNSTNPEALDALARESVRTRRTVVAVSLLAVALALGAVAFVVRSSRSAQPLAQATVIQPVLIESEPAGTRVEWDGKLLGETPLTARLPLGTQTLKLSKDGYAPEELTVNVTADPGEKRSFITMKAHDAPSPSAVGVAKVTRPPPVAAPWSPATPSARGARTLPRAGAPSSTGPVAPSSPPPPAVAAAPPSPAPAPSAPPNPSGAAAATAARVRVVDDATRVRVLDDAKPAKVPLLQ